MSESSPGGDILCIIVARSKAVLCNMAAQSTHGGSLTVGTAVVLDIFAMLCHSISRSMIIITVLARELLVRIQFVLN